MPASATTLMPPGLRDRSQYSPACAVQPPLGHHHHFPQDISLSSSGQQHCTETKSYCLEQGFFPSVLWHTSQVFKIVQDRIRDWLLLFYFFSSLKEKGVEMFLKVPLSSSSLTVAAGRCMATCAEGEQTPERCDFSPESASSHFFGPYV